MGRRERLVVLEGGVGAGKTTVVGGLKQVLPEGEWEYYREPGGTVFGDQMREAVQSLVNYDVDAVAAFLAYSASRANLVALRVVPALERGLGVVSDRWWYSSYAYQGSGEAVDKKFIMEVSMKATRGLVPGAVLHYDLLPEIGMARKWGKEDVDRFDLKRSDFHYRVRDAYLELAERYPEFWRVIDASQSKEGVMMDTVRVLHEMEMI